MKEKRGAFVIGHQLRISKAPRLNSWIFQAMNTNWRIFLDCLSRRGFMFRIFIFFLYGHFFRILTLTNNIPLYKSGIISQISTFRDEKSSISTYSNSLFYGKINYIRILVLQYFDSLIPYISYFCSLIRALYKDQLHSEKKQGCTEILFSANSQPTKFMVNK